MPHQNIASCSIEHGNVNLARYIGVRSISMPCQQCEEWNLFVIWAHLFNKFCIPTNSDDGHEPNSQLLSQQECLDLQMPEKLEQIFEYRQTQPSSLTVKQDIPLQQFCAVAVTSTDSLQVT